MAPESPSEKTERPNQKAEESLARARAAHGARKFAEARLAYDAVVRDFGGEEEARDVVDTARAFRALLDAERPAGEPSALTTFLSILAGLGVWVLIGLGVAAIFVPRVRSLWADNWKYLIGSFIVIVLLIPVASAIERRLGRWGERSQWTLVILLVVPLIVLAMMTLIAFGANRMAFALELVLILVAALIPAAAFYLFLVTRRPSILNEFVSSLGRLGLLRQRRARPGAGPADGRAARDEESREERRARIESYFQRFEAIYGALRFEDAAGSTVNRSRFVERLIHAVDTDDQRFQIPQAAVRITDVFRPNLIIPIGLVTMLTTLGWLLVLQPDLAMVTGTAARALPPAGTESPTAADLTLTFSPVGFAFLGAYFFGIQLLFRRFVRRDLGPNAYFAFANRILLAMIAVWVTVAAYSLVMPRATPGTTSTAAPTATESPAGSQVATPTQASDRTEGTGRLTRLATGQDAPPGLLLLAFTVGVFPRVLWQFVSAAVAKAIRVKFVLPSFEAKQPLSELDGLTVWHESRLEEEDVENIPNMASVDVVDLMLHTQIPAERLVGWIDQAILYSVLGPQGASADKDSARCRLRSIGLRAASQLVAVYHGTDEERQALTLGIGGKEIHTVVRAVEIEGNFDAVRSWRQV